MKPTPHTESKMEKAQGPAVSLQCPHCHLEQRVHPDGLSIFCGHCHRLIHVQEVLHPPQAREEKSPQVKTVPCFRCRCELFPPVKAQSVMCKKCGYRNDLADYHVKQVLSQDLETRGLLHIAPGATVLNSTARVKEAVIAGKFIGRLHADGSVILKSGAIFEGGLTADSVTLESGVQCRIKKEFQAKRIIIAGLYHGHITTSQYVELKRSARFIGSLVTQNLILEDGASLLADLKVGVKAEAIPASSRPG